MREAVFDRSVLVAQPLPGWRRKHTDFGSCQSHSLDEMQTPALPNYE